MTFMNKNALTLILFFGDFLKFGNIFIVKNIIIDYFETILNSLKAPLPYSSHSIRATEAK